VTDIEGNYDYWRRYIEFSKVICGTPGDIDFCDDRGQLVFGGDICDRGAGSYSLTHSLTYSYLLELIHSYYYCLLLMHLL